ncbi:hypothetical protein BDV95DRAFT_507702 [Massariosphaeria phaeospora]|uniref:Rhodopsin domain-containing protein n=1 Tax=Massariosphaeria phaeospora TaxID=100035 RepID=A0A7C8LZZ1_9PLEO|nr:hypothetical protein BDV95DRAFT_507702 [Massariosphaeria phaeospora]
MADSNGPTIIVALWVLTIIPLLFMILRWFCKRRYSKLFGWDDWLLALSWVFVVIYTALLHASVGYGIGLHFVDADMVKLVTGVKYMYLGEFFALLAMPTAKTSFCVTLLRLTAVPWHKWIIWFVIVTTNASMWAVAAMTFAQCSPIEKLWNLTLPGKCWDNRIVIYFSIFVGAYSALMDILLAICPWLIIGKLQMNKRQKSSLIAAMSMGCLAGVACIVKTTYLPLIGTWTDFTYNIGSVLIWGLAESSIIIVAASVPFLRLLAKEVSSRSGSGSRSRSRSQGIRNTFRLTNRSKSGGVISSAGRVKTQIEAYGDKPKDDEGSDKSILGEARADKGKIMQTNEVRIEFGESGDDVSHHDGQSGKGARTFFV